MPAASTHQRPTSLTGMTRCVVLDIGGVLEVTPATHWAPRWEADAGLAPGTVADRLGDVFSAGMVGAMTEAEVLAATGDRLGVSSDMLDRFWAEMWREYLGHLNVELYEWFKSLRPGLRTGILSNSFVGAREREQQLYGFADHTDVLIYSHEVGLLKPDPAVYELACRLLDVPPSEVVLVDDSPGATEGARAAGWRPVLFQDTAQVIAEVTALIDS